MNLELNKLLPDHNLLHKFSQGILILCISILIYSCGGSKVDCETFPRIYIPSEGATLMGLNKYEYINSQFIQTTSSIQEFTSLTGITELGLLTEVNDAIIGLTVDSESTGTLTSSTDGDSEVRFVRLEGDFINAIAITNYTEALEEISNCNELSRCIYVAYFVGQNSNFTQSYSHCNRTSLSSIISGIAQFQNPSASDVIYIARIEQALEAQ